jgi:two-component system, chemotaxis family, protein-glutamate methylesterase/glutaminase
MNNTRYQVMLVDDSAFLRGLFTRWLEEDDSIQVVAYAANGQQALKELEHQRPDVVVLDTDMPVMNGMQALTRILEMNPDTKVIMACTMSHDDAEISIKALRAGASDYIVKPANKNDLHANPQFRRELIDKIKALAAAGRRKQKLSGSPDSTRSAASRPSHERGAGASATHNGDPAAPAAPSSELNKGRLYSSKSIVLRPQSRKRPEILAIGCSTGGPKALFTLFSALKGHLHVPTVITQHMPADFTTTLAEHLSRIIDGTCKEGEDGEELIAGNVYLAPGNHHMLVQARGSRKFIKITQTPPENFCRPSVDPMMRSLKEVYQDAVLAVILTGMGQDGLKACRELADAGSTILAQDEASSVVWGMPGAVATNGLCSAVLGVEKLGPAISKVLEGGHL